MTLYSVISYNFGQYDLVRTPRIVDPDAEYIFVTDVSVDAPGWNVVVDDRLKGKKSDLCGLLRQVPSVRVCAYGYCHNARCIYTDPGFTASDS